MGDYFKRVRLVMNKDTLAIVVLMVAGAVMGVMLGAALTALAMG